MLEGPYVDNLMKPYFITNATAEKAIVLVLGETFQPNLILL